MIGTPVEPAANPLDSPPAAWLIEHGWSGEDLIRQLTGSGVASSREDAELQIRMATAGGCLHDAPGTGAEGETA